MFSDFAMHVIAVPQIAPLVGNVTFDGPDANEDFGLEQVTGNPDDRYKFRTSPIRNVALQPAFFHNGAFTTLEDAVRHHLDVFASMRGYNPHTAGVAGDLSCCAGPYRASARESRSRSGYADPLDRRGVPAPGRFRPPWTAGSARAAGEPGQAGSTIGPQWSSGPSLPMNSSRLFAESAWRQTADLILSGCGA